MNDIYLFFYKKIENIIYITYNILYILTYAIHIVNGDKQIRTVYYSPL